MNKPLKMTAFAKKMPGELWGLYDYIQREMPDEDPVDYIETLALKALKANIIDQTEFDVLKCRLPFYGVDRSDTDEAIKKNLVTRDNITVIESSIKWKLIAYILYEIMGYEPYIPNLNPISPH